MPEARGIPPLLLNHLGGSLVAGGKLKSCRTEPIFPPAIDQSPWTVP